MHPIDLFLLLIVLVAVWNGWRNGFIHSTARLIAWVGGILSGFFLYPFIAAPLGKALPDLGVMTFPLAFLGSMVLCHLLLSLLFTPLLKAVPPEVRYSFLNRFLGLAPGAVSGVIAAAIVALVLLALPLSNDLSRAMRNSPLVNRITLPAAWAEQRLSPVLNRPVGGTMTRLTFDPHSEKPVKLPFTTDRVTSRPDLEAQMLRLLNQERARAGVGPLVADTALRAVGRAHSTDMFERGYFSHVTPEGVNPFDRMLAAGIRYTDAGENLALAPTLPIAHSGLMHSPGHRANILNPAFHRVGIGIIDGGMYGLMVSQEFRN